MHPKHIGPFKVLKHVNDVTYRLDLPLHFRVSRSFHVSLLKPVVTGSLDDATPDVSPPPPELIDRAPVYAVRRLLDSRRRGGQLQYLVDWEGHGPEEQCWMPARDVLGRGLIAESHSEHPEKTAPRFDSHN